MHRNIYLLIFNQSNNVNIIKLVIIGISNKNSFI